MDDFINAYRELNKIGVFPTRMSLGRKKYILVLKLFGAKNKNQLFKKFKQIPELKIINQINIIV